jgi:hypothetical protein
MGKREGKQGANPDKWGRVKGNEWPRSECDKEESGLPKANPLLSSKGRKEAPEAGKAAVAPSSMSLDWPMELSPFFSCLLYFPSCLVLWISPVGNEMKWLNFKQEWT